MNPLADNATIVITGAIACAVPAIAIGTLIWRLSSKVTELGNTATAALNKSTEAAQGVSNVQTSVRELKDEMYKDFVRRRPEGPQVGDEQEVRRVRPLAARVHQDDLRSRLAALRHSHQGSRQVSADNFQNCLAQTLRQKGGKVDDPRDPGGRTAFGVTQGVYSAWLRRKGLPLKDVFLITKSEIAEIYSLQYWAKVHGDALPAGIDLAVFDAAVNSGLVQATKLLQAALGVKVDGLLGQATLDAVESHPNPAGLIGRICDLRLTFLRALRT